MLMRAATVVQVLQDLFLSFIVCFILLVIAALLHVATMFYVVNFYVLSVLGVSRKFTSGQNQPDL